MKVDICIPAYNEAPILSETTRRLLAFCEQHLTGLDWQIVLVVNGSTDDSAELAAVLARTPRVRHVVFSEGGRGQALKRYWLSSEADLLAYMDSDLAVNLRALPLLLNSLATGTAELSIGDRYHPRSRVRRGLRREFISRAYNTAARLLLGHRQRDLQCGFKAMTRSAFQALAPYASDKGWFFDTELVAWADRLKLLITSIPVEWEETRLGKRASKVELFSIPKDFLKPLWQLRRRLRDA